ncbi:protein POLLENLESS 3-like [Prosopis cineraria]|uniref:protein POLLENLESS 3-like n=1 Tax=Prosopis cineraria TaxID=364024 RepID=UPI002410B641|nr:protein POLLENLESS 3-like [Prosopis cineraria]XP_054802372.1 protein POLLENLESS 3-like [Prosopis cineraria]
MAFDRSSPARCFFTPPSTWKSRPVPPSTPISEKKRTSQSANKGDLFHVIHKVPAGDSPYVKAKHVQLVDKDPGRAISMFWGAINAGDRVESALKDMALVMKQLNRSDEAIEAIKSFRHLCPSDSQESLDNILVELYKRSGRIDEEIAMLQQKLKKIEDGVTFVGKRTKQARSQGKKVHITVEQEISRILGNLAWAYMQKGDYKSAEEHYRKALSFEPDRNKQCNLAICLMQMNNITEAKFLLQAVSAAYKNRKIDDSFAKSYERASQILTEIESQSKSQSQRLFRLVVDKECKEKPLEQTQNSIDEQKKGSYFESSSGKRSGRVHNVLPPHTEPKKCSWVFNNIGCQGREIWGDVNSIRRSPYEMCDNTAFVKFPGKVKHGANESASCAVDTQKNNQCSGLCAANSAVVGNGKSLLLNKSWADMVEEDEEELYSGGYTTFEGGDQADDDNEEVFNDENWNMNIICQKLGPLDPKDDGSESGEVFWPRNPTVRRSLCFDQQMMTPDPSTGFFCSSTSPNNKTSNSENQRMLMKEKDFIFQEKKPARRNRLQVFQDITLNPGTP